MKYGIIFLLCVTVLEAVSYKDCVYRRAIPNDVPEILDVMNVIEQSAAHQYLPLQPYTMRAHYVENLINGKSLFIAVVPDNVVAMSMLTLVPFNYVKAEMSGSFNSWASLYDVHDVFFVADLWFTQARYRRHGICTTLLGFAFQNYVPRIKPYVRSNEPLRMHCMVDFVDQSGDVVSKLADMMATIFDEFSRSVQQKYFSKSTHEITHSVKSFEITKSFYNSFVNDLEVAVMRPAKRYIFSITLE